MGSLHDILFVGTTHGRLLKLSSDSNTLIEALQVFPYHVPVRNILVADDQIIILSDHEVNAFPLQRCATMKSCGDCVALQVNLSECELFSVFSTFEFILIFSVLQDPYCAWDLANEMCINHRNSIVDRSYFIQDVELGYHSGCPVEEPGNFLIIARSYRIWRY